MVVRCWLLVVVVCCLLHGLCYVLVVVCRLLFLVGCLLFVACCVVCDVYCVLFVVCCLLSDVVYLFGLFVVRSFLCIVCCGLRLLFVVY